MAPVKNLRTIKIHKTFHASSQYKLRIATLDTHFSEASKMILIFKLLFIFKILEMSVNGINGESSNKPDIDCVELAKNMGVKWQTLNCLWKKIFFFHLLFWNKNVHFIYSATQWRLQKILWLLWSWLNRDAMCWHEKHSIQSMDK